MSPETIKNQKTILGDDYIQIWTESFLNDRKAQSLAKGTISFYKIRLEEFLDYLDTQEIKFISQITPNNIRDYLLLLEERQHNALEFIPISE